MEEARQAQFTEKERRLAEQAKQERDEFLRIITTQKAVEEQERKIEEEKKNVLKTHSQQVRTQIQNNEEIKRQQRLDYLEEGRKVRQNLEAGRQKIETIKEKKLSALRGSGVEEKYTAELSRKKIK